MDFDSIEKLTDERVMELYDGVIENDSTDIIAGNLSFVRCSNGRSGYWYERYTPDTLRCEYRFCDFDAMPGRDYFAICQVCGLRQWAYHCETKYR